MLGYWKIGQREQSKVVALTSNQAARIPEPQSAFSLSSGLTGPSNRKLERTNNAALGAATSGTGAVLSNGMGVLNGAKDTLGGVGLS